MRNKTTEWAMSGGWRVLQAAARLSAVFLVMAQLSGCEVPVGNAVDLDGDGVESSKDCNDADANVWLTGTYEGNLITSDCMDFCTFYCSRSVKGNVDLYDGLQADVDSLSCLTSVTGNLAIKNNESINNLAALTSVSWVGGSLTISNNVILSTVAFPKLEAVLLDLEISNNHALRSNDFGSLKTVGGVFKIADNPNFGRTNPFSKLVSVGTLNFSNNDFPQSNYIFSALTTIDKDLVVSGNDYLDNVSSFLNVLTHVGNSFQITDNKGLCTSDAQKLLNRLVGFTGTSTISGNKDCTTTSNDADGDGYSTTNDCDDNNNYVHPDAPELCNGKDDNCDTQIDEGLLTTYYPDLDNDGYGDPSSSTQSCSDPGVGYATTDTDCDDNDNSVNPGATEVCNDKDDNCTAGIDEDVTTTYYLDNDGDGYGSLSSSTQACTQPDGYVSNSADCNDGDNSVHPDATEVCNGIDDNCDLFVDGANAPFQGSVTVYLDQDMDTYGKPVSVAYVCPDINMPGTTQQGGDCNDNEPQIHPNATEICNTVDDDCDGLTDALDPSVVAILTYPDSDGDGYGSNTDPGTQTCPPLRMAGPSAKQTSGTSVTNNYDCNDNDPDTYPGAAEICNGNDENCDGRVDEGVTTTYYRDADFDGYGDPRSSTQACPGAVPAPYVATNTDCNDTDESVHPGAVEVCNGKDDNCNGIADEGGVCASVDKDGDGVSATDDCDDNNNNVWLTGTYEGDLVSGFTAFCTHYCSRSVKGNVALSAATQVDVDSLSCLTSVTGEIRIESNPSVVNLDGLRGVVSVGQNLVIMYNKALQSLDNFNVLTTVGGYLYIDYNDVLMTAKGFNKLATVGGFQFVENPLLSDVSDFSSLSKVGGDVVIWNNDTLPSLDNFNALTTVGGYLQINYNDDILTVDGFTSLATVGKTLEIDSNGALEDIYGFTSLTGVTESLLVQRNVSLTNLDTFQNLTKVGKSLYISYNDLLSNLGDFTALNTVGENLVVWACPKLTFLDNFNALTNVGKYLQINYNGGLQTADGFASLGTVGNTLEISTNGALTSAAFVGLKSIGVGLTVAWNPMLTKLNFTKLTSVGQSVSITSNPSLCMSYVVGLIQQLIANGFTGSIADTGNNNGC